MTDLKEKINKELEAVALEVVTLEEGDIPAMGGLMNRLCNLEENSRELGEPSFIGLTQALKGYLERLILSETDDLGPLEEGIDSLQSIYRSIMNQGAFKGNITPILNNLGSERPEPEEGESDEEGEYEQEVETGGYEELGEEDRQILGDFVIESLENLETIEVGLIDLEQDPNDLETINAIFRPFHTIKGVSGFLNLEKINNLAHKAENLLDKARNGEIILEGGIIDIILESVDMLKKMIQGVQEGLRKGGSLDNGIDIYPLLRQINRINYRVEQGGGKFIGEILIQHGEITHDDLEEGLAKQKIEPDKKIGEILIHEKKTGSKEVISALRDQRRFNRQHVDLQVKVDIKKLDKLVDFSRELVIVQAKLRQNRWILSAKDQELYQNLNQLNQIASDLQRTAMSMRMVPIKSTFQKMVRLVRDLAKNSGKSVGLGMSGEDTEIDRNVVEELYEPMIHMIRNAVDHGIEAPEEREKSGKKRKGNIYLRAFQKGGHIIIEIEDDGRGLDKDRIIDKAKSSNLITDEGELTESEIYNLIFQPGFSTAKKVTDISGRGVGMDVVKKAVEKMSGRAEISSRPGQGSTFIISLPLTLAIVGGMLVRVG